jgi:hypothetical protein
LAPCQDDLDRLAGRDGVLGDLDGMDVAIPTEARADRVGEWGSRGRCRAPGCGTGQLGGAWPGGALQGFEDGRLGDPVATLEIGGLRVERRDRRERVGQVVEHQDEVGLDERGERHAYRILLRQGDRRLEAGDGVIGEGPDGTAREAGHPVGRLDAPARDEGADRGKRVRRFDRVDGKVRGVGRNRDGPGLDAGESVAHLQEPPRADAEEGIAPQPLTALD